MKKQPEITERTKQRFADALRSLIKEKPISKITVSELTRRTGYNRSTFYEYFLDINDLVDYVETKLLEDIKKTVLRIPPENKSVENMFQIVFTAMNEDIYLLAGDNGDSAFFAKARVELIPIVANYFPHLKDAENFDYLTCFVSSAVFGLLQHWNEKGKDISTQEISNMMQSLVLNGLRSFVSPDLFEQA